MSIPTPLEASGGTHTTYAEEIAFWAALAVDSPRFSYESVGLSAFSNREMWLIRIGYPSAPTAVVQDNSMFITAGVHGTEFAAHEAAIKLVRDLCYTTDPDLTAYLADHPIFVMPTCNPDQIEAQGRPNRNNVDLNRDHLALTQSETRAIATAIGMVQPTLVIDMHERTAGAIDMEPIKSSHPQIHPDVLAVSAEMFDASAAASIGAGYTHGPYAPSTSVQPAMLVNTAGLVWGCPALTPETSRADMLAFRMDIQKVVVEAVIEYHRNHIEACASAKRAAREGRRRSYHSLMDGPILAPQPTAYRVDAAQFALLAEHVTLWGLEAAPDGAGYLVPVQQAVGAAVPLILDEESPYSVTVGVRVYDPLPAIEPISWGPVKIAGVSYPVSSVSAFQSGALAQVWP